MARYIFQEIRHSGKQALAFILCVVLSIATMIALNSFKRDVNRFLVSEARALHGGDIIVHSHHPLSSSLLSAAAELQAQQRLQFLQTTEFYSVVSSPSQQSLLANIMAVDPEYPFFGVVQTESGRHLSQLLKPGSTVIDREAFERLDIRIGDKLRVGESSLVVEDVITFDSTRPVSFFSFGPRVLLSTADLAALNLTGKGSRIQYEMLIKVSDSGAVPEIFDELKGASIGSQERVETAQNARSRLKRFFDNLIFFLSFISIFTLLLSGVGMQGALSAMLRQKRKTIAVSKAMGATHKFLLKHYLLMALALGLVGCLGGIIAGFAIKLFFPILFHGLLPADINSSLSFADLFEGVLLGVSVIFVFTLLPLYRLSKVKPAAIFRSDTTGPISKTVLFIVYATGTLFLGILVIMQLEDVKIGIYFMLGLLALIVMIAIVTTIILQILCRLSLPGLALRQAVKSLFRPGNATRSIVVTLSSAFSVLLTIFLLKLNLFASYIDAYPKDAPNLFCLDIQNDQRELFQSIVDRDVEFFPVIRARLSAINGEPIDQEKERERKSDNLGREFNLTYRDHLLDDEKISEGEDLFSSKPVPDGFVEVSVLDTIADIGEIRINDRLSFNIQGVEVKAQVSSIRTRTKSKLSPFFYFVFKPEVLQSAPQTLFAALNLDKDKIPEMITKIVTEMPQVSTINVADVAVKFGALLQKLSLIITFFTTFSIIAGLLILVSSAFSTQVERIREAVYYKILGGTSSFILSVVTYENTIMGVICSCIALAVATVGSWVICDWFFDISFTPYYAFSLAVLLAMILLIVVLGLISSTAVVRQKPAAFLRQQNGA